MEPTRELATQVQDQVNKFTSLKSCLLYGGGESKYSQRKLLLASNLINILEILDKKIKNKNPNILVCTPGRLIDIINTFGLNLSEVKYFVLDEGDRMLDMGFQDDIEYIQNCIVAKTLTFLVRVINCLSIAAVDCCLSNIPTLGHLLCKLYEGWTP